jgi:hypothetical protein
MAETLVRVLETGVETLAVRTELGQRPPDRILYNLRKSSSIVSDTYRLENLPKGLGYAAIQRTPQGWAFAAEANLTTLLHGPGSEVGSLSAGEIPLAVDVLFRHLEECLPPDTIPTEPWRYDVTRYDPSTTLRLPDSLTPAELVATTHRAWTLLRKGSETVSHHASLGQTVTHILNLQHHSRSVYDKSQQARSSGKPCPPNLVRLEARVRPSTVFPASEVPAMVERSSQELAALAASIGPVMHTATRVSVRTLMTAQQNLGEEPNHREALILTGVSNVLDHSGSVEPLIQDGCARTTAYRYRARLRALLATVTESQQDHAAADIFGMSEVVLARQLMASMAELSEGPLSVRVE